MSKPKVRFRKNVQNQVSESVGQISAFENVVCLKSSAVYFTNIFDECQYRGNQCGFTLFDQEASKSF